MVIDIEEFKNKYEENYKMLYQKACGIKGYYGKIKKYNRLTKRNDVRELLKRFILHRGDFISSDRECVAFVLTLENYM